MSTKSTTTGLKELLFRREKELESALKDLKDTQSRVSLLINLVENLRQSLKIEEKLSTPQVDMFNEKEDGGAFTKTYDISYSEMAEKVLNFYYREMKVPELYQHILEMGYSIKGKQPKNTLRGILSKYHKVFYKSKNGEWGLNKWNKK